MVPRSLSKLSDGQAVSYLHELHTESTYQDVQMGGYSAQLNDIILRRLPAKVREVIGRETSYTLVAPVLVELGGQAALPRVLRIALFVKLVRGVEKEHAVVWFEEWTAAAVTVPDSVASALEAHDWREQ